MATEHIEALGMEEDQVRALVDFYEAYVDLAVSELEATAGSRAGASVLAVRRRDDDVWAMQMDAASALREAGQWCALVDPLRAATFLGYAGRLFWSLGYPFGLFLMTQFVHPDEEPVGIENPMDRAAIMLRGIDASSTDGEVVPPPMRHPQQQAYMLLTMAADAYASERHRGVLGAMIERSPHRDGAVPVGALGVPIRHWWEIARVMLGGEPPAPRHFAPFLTRYGEAMESAGANAFLWRGGGAPVDVVDIDVMGIMVAVMRRFGIKGVAPVVDGPEAPGSTLLDLSLDMYRAMTG